MHNDRQGRSSAYRSTIFKKTVATASLALESQQDELDLDQVNMDRRVGSTGSNDADSKSAREWFDNS